MTTSNPLRINLLQLPTHPQDFSRNLKRLKERVGACTGDIVITPEVCLTGYPYDRMEEAAALADEAIKSMAELSKNRVVTLTAIVKERGEYYNRTFVFHDGRIAHEQDKIRLFLMGDEHKYFRAGDSKKMRVFEAGGLKMGLMVCFELRYAEFWHKLRGAELIVVPARWGLPRKQHLQLLPHAMAVANQCYVAVANSADEDMAKSSGLYTPGGGVTQDDYQTLIEADLDRKLITKVRRHIPMGGF
ncbi:MAG: carbon-nitrogen hydrolase family protein [Epsilonproteobacteria bacterium]|nr:carbon-nitrogen hydrolase family protein [Campylobacterota bacterium]